MLPPEITTRICVHFSNHVCCICCAQPAGEQQLACANMKIGCLAIGCCCVTGLSMDAAGLTHHKLQFAPEKNR